MGSLHFSGPQRPEIPKSNTQNPKPQIQNPKPKSLDARPKILNAKPKILNPKIDVLNAKQPPATVNPAKPGGLGNGRRKRAGIAKSTNYVLSWGSPFACQRLAVAGSGSPRPKFNPKPFATQNPKPKKQNPKTNFKKPKPKTQYPNPKSNTQHPKSNTQHPKPKSQNPKSKI